MAVITSPFLYGARGRIDGVVFKQLFGNTIASARPRGGRRRLSVSQAAQASAFRLAVACCKWTPAWASMAFERSGMASPYNVAVSYLTKAIKTAQLPLDAPAGLFTALSALRTAAAFSSSGTASDASCSFTAGEEALLVEVSSTMATRFVVYYTQGVSEWARSLAADIVDGTGSVSLPANTLAAVCVPFVDLRPCTMGATAATYLGTSFSLT